MDAFIRQFEEQERQHLENNYGKKVAAKMLIIKWVSKKTYWILNDYLWNATTVIKMDVEFDNQEKIEELYKAFYIIRNICTTKIIDILEKNENFNWTIQNASFIKENLLVDWIEIKAPLNCSDCLCSKD